MAIYDCLQFFDEEHILDLRLNILDEFVDFFVIVSVGISIVKNLVYILGSFFNSNLLNTLRMTVGYLL